MRLPLPKLIQLYLTQLREKSRCERRRCSVPLSDHLEQDIAQR